MTRIRFKALRAIALLQLGLLALLQLADAELEFYQDEEPKLSNNGNNNLERLVRLLEAKRHSHQYQQMQPVEPVVPRLELERAAEEEAAAEEEREELLYEKKLRKLKQQLHQQLQQQFQQQLEERQQEQERSHQQHLLELARQKQRGLLRDDLPERPSIIDALQREAAADPLEYVLELERQRLLPYLEFEPEQRSKPYSIEDETRARLIPAHANKDPMLDYPESQDVDLQRARGQLENARRLEEARRPRPPPPFTIDLDKLPPASDPNGPPPFAVRPNDPRYFHQDHHDKHGHKESHELPVKAHPVKLPEHERKSEATTPSAPRQRHKEFVETLPKTSLVEVNMLPEPRRRAEQDPMIISLDRSKTNNDVYFIAIVAGCSAATMFALVLISLTWCRLQRVSKAAADVEYPAYGVTGPNKDMSPSGDQRLAQSAQMYHFQHQKQQIIAMENRASAARDPGSVSEAESDEENEEGDYTVYECPGLAPTAEMEVKNPLFDDDPTPATPARSRRSADDDV